MAKKDVTSKKRDKKTDSTEDVIEVKKVEKGSAVVAGRNAKAFVINFAQGNPIFLGLLTIIIVGAIATLGYFLLHTPVSLMTGEFNIAILPFDELRSDKLVKSEVGQQIAAIFASRLDVTATEIFQEENIKTEVRGPEQYKLPSLNADDTEGLDNKVEVLAEQINAQIVIYGYIEQSEFGGIFIIPKFYLSPNAFGAAQELLGSHSLGKPILIHGNTQIDANRDLQIRTETISFILKGLGAYIEEEYETSLRYYDKAVQLGQEINNLELIYLLIGNANTKYAQVCLIQGETQKGLKILSDANDAYDKALDIDNEYARAYLGKSGVEHIRATYLMQISGDFSDFNLTSIQREIELIDKAERSKTKPSTADINIKVIFARAQIKLLYATYDSIDTKLLEEARNGYSQVVVAYDDGKNPRIREFAASSFSGLGIISRLLGNPAQAIENFKTAIELTNIPSRKALFLVYIGNAYLQDNDLSMAKKYFEEALTRESDLQKTMPQKQINKIKAIMNEIQTK